MPKIRSFWLVAACFIVSSSAVSSDEPSLVETHAPAHVQAHRSAHRAERFEGPSTAETRQGFTSDLHAPELLEEENRLIASVVHYFDDSLPRVAGEDPQARTLLDYYMTQALFARPRVTGAIMGSTVPGGTLRSGSLFIILAVPEEARRLGDEGANLSPCRYRADMPAVLMDAWQMTSPWEEVVFLHELWHAYSDRVLHTAATSPLELIGTHSFAVVEEAEAHALQYRLLDQYTSGQYRATLDRLARERLATGNTDLSARPTDSERDALQSLFLPCETRELSIRVAQYHIDLGVAMARVSRRDQDEARRTTLRAVYALNY